MTRRLRVLAACALVTAATEAVALPPADVYALVSPSVWKVVTYDVDGLPLGQGSAVVIAPDTLVTNCHVLAKATRVAVRRDKTTLDARLELWDPQRDVCQIKAAGSLGAPAVAQRARAAVAPPGARILTGRPAPRSSRRRAPCTG